MELVLAGHSEAFEPLVTPYRNALLAMAYRLSHNREDAGELCPDASSGFPLPALLRLRPELPELDVPDPGQRLAERSEKEAERRSPPGSGRRPARSPAPRRSTPGARFIPSSWSAWTA